jgi:hypothetical protein
MYRYSWAQQSLNFISLCLCTATANSLVAQSVPSQLPDQSVGPYSDKIWENSVLSHRMTSWQRIAVLTDRQCNFYSSSLHSCFYRPPPQPYFPLCNKILYFLNFTFIINLCHIFHTRRRIIWYSCSLTLDLAVVSICTICFNVKQRDICSPKSIRGFGVLFRTDSNCFPSGCL